MEEPELREVLDEYADKNTEKKLVEFLKEELTRRLKSISAESDSQRHDLNLLIREIEEDLDWIESEKLAEFDPEQQ